MKISDEMVNAAQKSVNTRHGLTDTEMRAALEAALSAAEPSVAVKALRDDRRMLVSHATMGRTDGEGQSVNDICVTITKLRNELYEEAKKTALTAQVQDVVLPEGWQLVPKEPTLAMISAYCETMESHGIQRFANGRTVWPAMLAAARTR